MRAKAAAWDTPPSYFWSHGRNDPAISAAYATGLADGERRARDQARTMVGSQAFERGRQVGYRDGLTDGRLGRTGWRAGG